MTKGDAGQNISKFASSSTEASKISTSLPYISYVDLYDWLIKLYNSALSAVDAYFQANPSVSNRSASGFQTYCANSSAYSTVFVSDSYRLCRACKLLMSLGYGNFASIPQYDIYAMAEKYVRDGKKWSKTEFDADPSYSIYKNSNITITNSPNLSIRPLLAYHKICNDHYRNEKWQPFEPWTCNIDYLSPSDNMDAKSFISADTFTSLMTSIIDLENSNLPIDYFTSVLPRAQYGDESAVPIGLNNAVS